MKKIQILFSLVMLASLILGACAPAATTTPGAQPTTAVQPTQAVAQPTQAGAAALPDLGGREITIAVENAYLPFNFVSLKTGQAEGWDYDFINEACKRLNCTPKWVEFAWDTMIASVAQGQFDMAADGITITAERAKQVDFSEGYVNIDQRLMVRADETRFTTIEELAKDSSLLLAEQVGTTNYETAKKYVPENRIKSFDTFGLAVQALITGDVDGVVIDEVAGLGYLGANKDKVKLIGPSISSDQLGFIFPKGSDLVAPFNAVIDQMKADGTLDQINTKWFSKSTEDITAEAGGIGPGAYATPVGTPAATAEATAAPTAAPATDLGTDANPIIMALAPSATSEELQTGGEAIAAKLSELTGYVIKTSLPTNYAALIEAMGSGNAQIGWLPPIAYVVAKEKGYADVALAVVRFGSDHYGVQFVANAAEGFTSYFDAATSKSTADAKTALAQLDGKKPCYTDPLSASGYVIPAGILAKEGIKVKAGAWVQGHPTVIKSVYLSPKGEICDFGTTYIDARSAVVKDFPDVNDKVVVLWVSDPIIPNDNVSFASNVPADVRQKITDALLELSSTEEGRTLLKNGGYDIESLKQVDDTFYDEFRVYLEAMNFDITSFK